MLVVIVLGPLLQQAKTGFCLYFLCLCHTILSVKKKQLPPHNAFFGKISTETPYRGTHGHEYTSTVHVSVHARFDWYLVDCRVAGHLGDAVGLKTLSIHVCICPHFGM